MDLFSALQTSVSGLQAQSYAISNISGNIANSQTTGFKRTDTNFVDLIAEQTAKREVSGTVLAQAQLTNTLQGNIVTSTVPTNVAINGQGFFTVVQKTGDASGSTTFSPTTMYTRRGDFSLDKDGYLVNGGGSYLLGQNLDPASGQPTSNGLIKLTTTTLPAKPTATINYAANLPATPITTASTKSGGSSLYTSNPTATVTTGSGQTGVQVAAANAPTFIDNSIAGPAITAYTSAGAPVTVTTRWAKIQDATASQDAVWNLYYQSDTTVASANSAWTNVGTAFTFDSSGQLTGPTGGSVPINALTVNNTNLGTVNLAVSKAGLTQYADASGTVTTNTLNQDGFAAGTLSSLAVGADGKVNGTFSNGSVIALATMGVVRFANPDGLKPQSAGNYLQTADSGAPLAGLAGSTLVGASIEQSNTDIANEFSKMIVTQQAYSANTRVMSTAQSMMTDLLNVIR